MNTTWKKYQLTQIGDFSTINNSRSYPVEIMKVKTVNVLFKNHSAGFACFKKTL